MNHGGRPQHCAWIIPYLTVQDSQRTLDFYEKAFGFEKGLCMKGPDGKIGHAEMTYQGQTVIMLAPELGHCESKAPASRRIPAPSTLYVYCPDVDALYEKARRAGAEIVMPPVTMFWGDRMTRMLDPDGYSWCFATNVSAFDPSKAGQCSEK